jgi:hypothetical protein
MEPLVRLRQYLAEQMRFLDDERDNLLFELQNETDPVARLRLANTLTYLKGQMRAYDREFKLVCTMIKREQRQKMPVWWRDFLMNRH